jgi:branched-chain amino acid aminotransferase
LLYGDGVFEGIRFYNGCAFRLQAHLHRLQESASAIGLTIPYSAAQLAHAVDEIVGDFHQPDGYLRLIVTRGCGLLGLDPAVCTQPNVILIADRLNIVPAEKRADGVDEAIMLNTHGNVAEGSAENVFVVREQTLLTPRTTDGALRGITRETVLELAAAAGIAAERTMLTCYDLYNSDECFLTGTGAELIPVREINGRRLPASPGPIFATLMDAFEQLVRRETMRP